MSTITYTQVSAGESNLDLAVGISADGHYAAFLNDGVVAPTVLHRLTVRNLETGVARVIVQTGPDTSVGFASLSADGRFVAYEIFGTTQVQDPGEPLPTTISYSDLYVFDQTTGTTQQVAANQSGRDRSAIGGQFSADGRFLDFTSDSPNLVPNDTNESRDLFRLDMQTGAIRRLSEKQFTLSSSADGRYVSADRGTDTIVRLDVETGATAFIASDALDVTFSANGRFAAFSTNQSLLSADTNGSRDVYVRDLSDGSLRLVSTSTSGAVGDSGSFNPSISADGGRVTFATGASNLSPETSSQGVDVVVKDLATGILGYVATTGDTLALPVFISGDGLSIGFSSKTALVGTDTDGGGLDAYLARFIRPTVAITSVSGDNVVNAAESMAPVTVTGTSNAFGRPVLVTSPTGATASTTVGADGSWSVTISAAGLADGTRGFLASVLDDAGIRGETRRDVVFDSTPPDLTLFSVTPDNIVNAAEASAFQITGRSDAIGQTISISLNGAFAGFATVGPTGDWSQTFDFTGRLNQQYDLDVSVFDAAGNRTLRSISFDLDTTPPQIAILSVGGDNVVDATELAGPVHIAGTSDAIGASVRIVAGNQVRGTAIVQSDGTWQADISLAGAVGSTVVFASVADRAGNPGGAAATVQVDTDLIRISTTSEGLQPPPGTFGDVGFYGPSISADGHLVAFESYGDGIVAGGGPFADIVIKDLRSGAVTLISKSQDGSLSNGTSLEPSLSADGRFVAFQSTASNLVADDTNGASDIFVAEVATGLVRRVVVASGPQEEASVPSISADGRFLAYELRTSMGMDESTSTIRRIYVKDLQTDVVTLVSADADGMPQDGFQQSISANGRYVAFTSTAGNVSGDVFVRDLLTGELTLVSAGLSGSPGNGGSSGALISPDGSHVVFYSEATDLVAGSTGAGAYVRDLGTGTTTFVYPLSAPLNGSLAPKSYSITDDNRYVAFSTFAAGVPGDIDNDDDIYVRDLLTGRLTLVSSGNGPTDAEFPGSGIPDAFIDGNSPRLTADGRYIAFGSFALDLVPGDTNRVGDVFLRRLIPQSLILNPLSGDDRIEPGERSAALPIGGTSSVIGGTVSVSVDGTVRATATVGTDGAWASTLDVTALPAGRHSVVATVLDGVGLPTSDGSIVTVVQGPQTLTLALAHDTGSSASDQVTSDGTLVLTATEPGQTIAYSADFVTFSPTPPSFGSDGFKTVFVRATDANGVQTALANVSFTLDRTPPSLTAALQTDTGVSGDRLTRDPTLALLSVGGTSILYAADGGAFETAVPSFARDGSADGPHTIQLRATDLAGNTGDGPIFTFTLDTSADLGARATLAIDATANGSIDRGEAARVAYAVAGLDADATGLATFTDGIHTVMATVAADGSFVVDLSGLSGSVSSSLAIIDAAGNAAAAAGNTVQVGGGNSDLRLFGTIVTDASGPAGQIYELYEGLLGRAPDPTGFEFWLEKLGSGASLGDVAAGFLGSDEYVLRHGPIASETDAAFVADLYSTVLGRPGDTDGIVFWNGLLAGGLPRNEVARDFALSTENIAQDRAILSAGVFVPDPVATDVARLYYAILDRAPDADGLIFWTGVVKGGTSEIAVAQAFLGSAEYGATFGSPSDAAFVTALYDGALGRPPEPAGIAFWQGALASGASRAQVALAIADGPEANAYHLVEIEQSWHLA